MRDACEQWYVCMSSGILARGDAVVKFFGGASFHHRAMSGQQHPENTQPEQQQPDKEEDSDTRISRASGRESPSTCTPLLITCITHHASCAL